MNRYARFKDQDVEARLFFHRTIWMLIFIVSLIALLITQLITLQVVQYKSFATKSKDNYIKVEPEPPSRGLIYDRNGILLAENKPVLSLQIIPEKIYCASRRKHILCIRDLFKSLRLYVTLDETDLQKFYTQYKKNRRYAKNFEPIILRQALTEEEQASIAAASHRLPGVYIRPSLIRHYPFPTSLAHVIGYVRQSSKSIEKKWTPEEKKNYAGTTHVGVQGIEKEYEKILHGTVGKTENERNVYGRIAHSKPILKPIAGKNIYLTIDIRLQNMAEKALGKKAGAVVAIDTKTGQVLALVSNPGFNPNLFVKGISRADYKKLQDHPQNPLTPRAVVGTYPPGSTIKPFYGIGSLFFGHMDPDKTVACKGKYFLPGVKRPWRDWKKEGHGKVALARAIMRSCDVYFYDLAHRMKIDKITQTLGMFGWGRKTGIDMPQEKERRHMGVLPSRAWKAHRFRKKNKWHQKWYPGDTVNVGIGQGNVTVTPLQLAVATATMANRGKLVIPHLLHAVQPAGSKDLIYLNPHIKNEDIPEYKLQKTYLESYKKRSKTLRKIKRKDWDVVHKGMIAVIHGWNNSGWGGTARRLIKVTKKRFKIAGKTGTAQVFSVHKDKEYKESEVPEHLKDNALFVAFAPAVNPRIAIAVVVEHGGHGGSAAAPVAGKLIKIYLADLLKDDPEELKRLAKAKAAKAARRAARRARLRKAAARKAKAAANKNAKKKSTKPAPKSKKTTPKPAMKPKKPNKVIAL